MKIDSTELQIRWNRAWQAKADEISKHSLIHTAKYQYEKHLKQGEIWGESFRFPELFGISERKFDNLIEIMPETKVRGDGDDVIALQAAIDNVKRTSNLERERLRAIHDAVDYGVGCIFAAPVRYERILKDADGKEKEELIYDGLGVERVDYRDIFPAHSALVLHDHTGLQACPYIFRRRNYYVGTFKSRYNRKPFNVDVVNSILGTTFGQGFSGDRTPTQKESQEKNMGDYVTVLEYWDMENDILRVFANGFENEIFDSKNGIPYSHKQLPFHFYYNYRRDDSIAGVGEIELQMPYNIFKEVMYNLMIDDAKLSLQPAYIIDGDINFNSEENELAPGAIFTARGLNGGKVGDSIMPFRTGGIPGEVFNLLNTIENSQISVTGDDVRSLFVNPNQLATQTLSKREAMQKRIRGNIVRNTVETEWYLHNQLISYIKNELAKPYKNKEGRKEFREIRVSGYDAIQDKPQTIVKFSKRHGVETSFFLNKKIAEEFDENEIEVVPAKLDAEIKRDKMEKIMMLMQQIFTASQTPEGAKLLQGMDVSEFLKETAKNLDLDIKKLFPVSEKDDEEIDVINHEHEQIAMGIVPVIKDEEDSIEHYQEHVAFEGSEVFKKFGKKAKDAMAQHKELTLKNIYAQKTSANTGSTGSMANAPQSLDAGALSVIPGVSGTGQGQVEGADLLPTIRQGIQPGVRGGTVPLNR